MFNKMISSRLFMFVTGMLLSAALMVACAATVDEPEEEAPAEEAEEEPEVEEEEAPAEEEEMEEEEMAEEEPAAQAGDNTLAEVLDRGVVRCGVNAELPGFGFIDADGNNVGFDVDFCRVVAAAALGDADAVEYVTLNAEQRFPALQTGEVDVLIRNTTWTLTRDTDLGLDFTATTFYDGQGFMVRAEDGFETLEDLNGATICVTSGTTTELNLEDTFAAAGIDYTPQVYAETADTHENLVNGTCDAETSDKSQLAALRSASENPDDFIILPVTISKEPLGPVVRANDSEWGDVVQWATYVTFEAERLGINNGNVDDFLDSEDIAVQRLLGTGEDDLGALLGIPADFGFQVISQVGNYADIYDASLAPIGIERAGSLNAHWTEGGLIYSPALR